jgi:hypothetical protein
MRIDSCSKNNLGWLCAVALIVSACGSDDLPKSSSLGVNGVRVLALRADKPEAAPGASVQLTALVTDLELGRSTGSNVTVRYEAEHCIDPTVGIAPNPSCDGNPTRVNLTSGTVTLSGPTYSASHVVGTITLPVAPLIFANRTADEQFNGIPYLFIYRATSGSKTETAFKRLIVSTRSVPNTNPSLTQITGAGSGLPAVTTALVPVLSGAEQFTQIKSGGVSEVQTEDLTVSWFINVGTLIYTRTDGTSSNTWTPPPGGGERPFLIAVVRDSRGGVGIMNPIAVGP